MNERRVGTVEVPWDTAMAMKYYLFQVTTVCFGLFSIDCLQVLFCGCGKSFVVDCRDAGGGSLFR